MKIVHRWVEFSDYMAGKLILCACGDNDEKKFYD